MQKYWKSTATALALVLAGTAHAELLDFEHVSASPDTVALPLLLHGDEFTASGYWFDPFANHDEAVVGGDLVGALLDGNLRVDICQTVVCPGGNNSTFYAGLNDGVLALGREDGKLFKLSSLDAGFVGALTPEGFGDGAPLVMQIQGQRANNSWLSTSITLPGPVNGEFQFGSYSLAANFQATAFKQIFFYGLPCDASGSCTGFVSDKGQFALDNLNVSAVPEPSQWLLMGLGLAVVANLSRRRRGQ
jgi:hypothetical protein